jgi:small basic protein
MDEMTDDEKPKPPLNWKVISGYILGGAAFATCIVISCFIPSWWLNVAICMLGFGLGWNVGFLLSPFPNEKIEFQVVAKAITAFLGGFVVAKLDALFGGSQLQALVSSEERFTRFLLFGITFLVGVQCTWVGRRYGMRIETKKADEPKCACDVPL